jgi:hypothetical protein
MEHQLLKYLYSETSDLVNKQSERIIGNFEKADKIIIWIVGFAIGILIILFNKEPSNSVIKELSSEIMISSLIIVIFGLLFRIFSFFTQMKMNGIMISLIMYSKGISSPIELPTPRQIKDSDNTNNIISYLNEDFKTNYKQQNLEKFTKEQLEKSREAYFNFYDHLAKSNDINLQMKEFTSNIGLRFGYSKKAIERKVKFQSSQRLNGVIYRVLINSSFIFFFLTIGLFIFGAFKILLKLI